LGVSGARPGGEQNKAVRLGSDAAELRKPAKSVQLIRAARSIRPKKPE
jgi:hypothetical protein